MIVSDTYKSELDKICNVNIDEIINLSKRLVPASHVNTPWFYPGLNHGTAILTNAEQLSCYIASYGEMHKMKMGCALERLPFAEIDDNIEIVDWGCGQGIASVCLIDELKRVKKIDRLRRVTLIEPSSAAIGRAALNVKAVTNKAVEIEIKEKFLPPTIDNSNIECVESIGMTQYIAIHIFSNILDIDTIDLKRVATMIADSGHRHYFICVGPLNIGNTRIDSFSRYFNLSPDLFFVNRSDSQLGRLGNGHSFTGKIVGFKSINQAGEPILTPISYYPAKQLFAAYKLDAIEIDQYEIGEVSLNAFDILAPFDFGACVYDDVHPILAVINNLIIRGLPTKASPFIESKFKEVFDSSKLCSKLGTISYAKKEGVDNDANNEVYRNTPIAIARIQKVVLEAAMTGVISLDSRSWRVLVKENDIPCAALAFEDLKLMFNHLRSLSTAYDDMQFPEVELTIISPNQYLDSRLHLDANVIKEINWVTTAVEYDMVIDIAMNLVSDAENVTFSEFRVRNNCYFNVRSSNSIYSKRQIYTTNRIDYKPLTIRNEQGVYEPIAENVEHLEYFLTLIFRKEHFRDGQLPILSRALQNKSVIGLLPTGGGKSLTYQLAAMLQPGVTIIIDPIVSLMKDQYDGLLRSGIDYAAYLNSTLTTVQKKQNELMMEESRLLFIFMSPERLCIYNFRERLKTMADTNVYFAYGVVDEVHCVSEWGHDFRFSYLHLGRNLYEYVRPKQDPTIKEKQCITLFGLTATASFDVLADVERELSGDSAFPLDSESVIRFENTNRLELQYNVVHIKDTKITNKWELYALKNLQNPKVLMDMRAKVLQLQEPQAIAQIKSRYIERENISDKETIKTIDRVDLSIDVDEKWYEKGDDGAAIVFCPHSKGTLGVYDSGKMTSIASRIAERFSDAKISRYAGGDIMANQDEFVQNKTAIMVATKAFGMGIDKSNVRFTLNINHSGSLEAFVQEAGRAGRDRKMALATIMYCDQLVNNAEWFEETPRMIAVDYGVHDFFFQGNFLGLKFETLVMHFLMDVKSTMIVNRNQSEDNPITSVAGFMGELMNASPNETITSYIYYNSLAELDQLNALLIKHSVPIVGAHFKKDEDRIQSYKPAISKAIYRMCSLGIIDDFTEDYTNKCFRIVSRRRLDGEYYKGLKSFLKRYYTDERAELEMKQAQNRERGTTEIQKCLGYLTEFVYEKIATKRRRAIDDMEAFCREAVSSNENWIDTNEKLKDFIYYYFNSKYAREGYQTESGADFSLTDDTEKGKRSSTDILFKYLRVVDDDVVGSSSPKDSVKHLQGAVRLIRRSLTDSNPTIDLLNVYSLLFLKQSSNINILKEMEDSYKRGYKDLYKRVEDKLEFYDIIKRYKLELKIKDRNVATDEEVRLLDKWEYDVELGIHMDWIKDFASNYTNKKMI